MKMDEERKEMKGLILSDHKLSAFMEQPDAGIDRRRNYGHTSIAMSEKKAHGRPHTTHPNHLLSGFKVMMGQWGAANEVRNKQSSSHLFLKPLNFSS